MTLEGTLLCARKSGQVENNAAAQLDDLFVQLGANGLGHDGVAEVGNKGGISNQGLWHFAGDFDWDKKLKHLFKMTMIRRDMKISKTRD